MGAANPVSLPTFGASSGVAVKLAMCRFAVKNQKRADHVPAFSPTSCGSGRAIRTDDVDELGRRCPTEAPRSVLQHQARSWHGRQMGKIDILDEAVAWDHRPVTLDLALLQNTAD